MILAGRVALLTFPPVTTVTGTLDATFGGMTATIVGTRTVTGTLASTFGGMTATMVGTRTNLGATFVSSFGGMTATMVGTIPGLGDGAAKQNPVSTIAPPTTVRTFNA
jgi:hypothetical protein